MLVVTQLSECLQEIFHSMVILITGAGCFSCIYSLHLLDLQFLNVCVLTVRVTSTCGFISITKLISLSKS